MFDDPIVAEIQKIRDEYARTFNYDLDAIYRDLKEQESRSSRTMIDRPIVPQKPVQGDLSSQEQPVRNDPIIDEIHKTREAILEQFNYDLDAIYRDLAEKEQRSARVIVDRSQKEPEQPRRPTEAA